MGQSGRSVDVVRMAGRGGDAPVEGLAKLADDHHIVDRARAQRPEHRFPGNGQGNGLERNNSGTDAQESMTYQPLRAI